MIKLKKEWQIMIESESIKKAIRHFECMKNDAVNWNEIDESEQLNELKMCDNLQK